MISAAAFQPRQWSALLKKLFSGPAFSAQNYWESRHTAMAGTLAAVGHAQLSETANQEQYCVKRDRIRDALLRHVPTPNGCRLLDAGCGVGELTKLYVELGFEVTGVDFSETAVKAARQAGIAAEFQHAALQHLSLKKCFDVVCVIDVLQHVVDDEDFAGTIGALGRHVKVDGLAVVVDAMVDGGACATHCRQRSLKHHEAEFRIAGLEVIEHAQFVLAHEQVTKDLVVLRRRF